MKKLFRSHRSEGEKGSDHPKVAAALAACIAIASLAIPGILDATTRNSQKRTVEELHRIAVSMQCFATDYGGYPPSRLSGNPHDTLTPFKDASGLLCIVPDLIQVIPTEDGWGTPYIFRSGPDGTQVSKMLGSVTTEHFTIGSLGSDRKEGGGDTQATPYSVFTTSWCTAEPKALGTLQTHCYESDIIWADSAFMQAPDGKQKHCK